MESCGETDHKIKLYDKEAVIKPDDAVWLLLNRENFVEIFMCEFCEDFSLVRSCDGTIYEI